MQRNLVPRGVLSTLVLSIPVLIVAFAVLMAGQTLARALEDLAAARVILWVALSCLMLLGIDMLLLITLLGVQALDRPDDDARRSDQSRADGEN